MRIQNSIDVPGAPEEVWEAIATGHGTETWFVPAEIEPHVGGKVALDMGGGMADAGTVTVYDPPHRFAYEEEWQGGRLATEFVVKAKRRKGMCVVRLVSTMHGEVDNKALQSLYDGWVIFLDVLYLHMTHFPGQRCHTVQAGGTGPAPALVAFAELEKALGLKDGRARRRVHTREGVPQLAGTVHCETERHMILRLDEPAPGVGLIYAYEYGGAVKTGVHLYLYESAAVADTWKEWMAVPSAG